MCMFACGSVSVNWCIHVCIIGVCVHVFMHATKGETEKRDGRQMEDSKGREIDVWRKDAEKRVCGRSQKRGNK